MDTDRRSGNRDIGASEKAKAFTTEDTEETGLFSIPLILGVSKVLRTVGSDELISDVVR
jgi:hypothetical protein